jgi:MFS family permease
MPEAAETPAPRSKAGFFYGWWIVLANAAIGMYVAGTFWYGAGLFINPIKQTLGWTTTEIALAFSIRSAESGPVSPIVGYFLDRFGPRWVTISGVLIAGAGFIMFSQVTSLPTFYGSYLLIALGTSACAGVTAASCISNWFVKKRGRAFGLYTGGFGLSGLIVPVMALLFEHFGWRAALICIGVGVWIIGLPLALVLRHRPETYGLHPDGETIAVQLQSGSAIIEGYTATQTLRHPSFWLLCSAFMLSMASLNAITIFLIPYLTDPIEQQGLGIPDGIAATAITALTLSSLFGRFGFSTLGDYYDRRRILIGLVLLQATGLSVLALTREAWTLIAFFALFGPSYGGVVAMQPAILADYFGRRSIGMVQGFSMGVMTLGGVLTPLLIGALRDATGGYNAPFLAVAAIALVAAPLLALARRPSWR